MKMWFPTAVVFVCLVVVSACHAGTFPEPAIVQSPSQWTLNVSYSQPRQITVDVPGEKDAKRYWYIILTLTNNSTTSDASFYPTCDLLTDTFKIVPAGKGLRKEVFRQIKRKHQGRYPFLIPIDQAENKILQGQDNTVDVAIIWPDFDPKAKEATLFIGGLSNEIKPVVHPKKTDANGMAKMLYLRKTLALKYRIGGDPKLRQSAGLKFLKKSWVMR